ncbi:hypothetical protein [Saccharothrix luteola]|uniref:hypothetical protein n=1 Tax=Saccharothrix luteola TaxID=2893018 RepID=UPI001E323669|nr:hypothetical protein [Saccharothrix luteola]MCC8246582.1 hypothetical protein [Saccharothrix luteola]
MVTDLTPTTISTPPPPGGDTGFTMDASAMDTLQQQADDLRTGYEEVSSKLSGQALAGNAFGTAGAFAVEAFNASNHRSVELTGKAASTLGLVGEGLKATAHTQQEADRASGEQFASVEPDTIANGPQGAPAGGPDGTATTQGPPVTPTETIPGGGASGTGTASQPGGPQVPPASDIPGADGTTQASDYTTPDPTGQGGGAPAGQGGGAPTGQTAGVPSGQMPPTPTMPGAPGTPTADNPTKPSAPAAVPTANSGGSPDETKTAAARTSTPPPQAATPQAAPVPDFPEIPDPPPVPSGSGGGGGASLADALKNTPTTGGTTPSATTPPPTPPIPEVPKDLFKQPTIPDLGTGSGSASGSAGGTAGGSGGSGGGPSGGMTPPPTPPIPEVPKDLFKQPTIPDLGTGGGTGTSGGTSGGSSGGGTGTPGSSLPGGTLPTTPSVPDLAGLRPGEQSPGDQGGRGDRDASDNERPGRDREAGDRDSRDREAGDREGRDREAGDRDSRDDREGRDREAGEHGGGGAGGGGGEQDGPSERDQHGFPITSVDGKPCLDLRDLPAEEGERWQETIRDILATKGEGSFFWAGDTIDAQGQRHSLMDLAEFMTNLDGRAEPDATERPGREVSDTVAASPARSANGDVYVLVGPNRAEGDPVELTDFPTLQANPGVERVFAIDALTGRETQIHPKVS